MTTTSTGAAAGRGTTAAPALDNWMRLSVCRAEPDLWFSEPSRRLAIHICRTHCPVRDQCEADAERIPCTHGVQAGVVYDQFGEPMEQQPKPSNRSCPTCAAMRPADTRKPPSNWPDCGTCNAYRRHCHRNERACEPCTEANRLRERDRKAAARGRAA